MVDPVQSCLTFASAICVTWDSSVPFWELLIGALLSGVVTVLTIVVSVRESRKATNRSLLASARAEARRRREEAVLRENAERRSLGQALTSALMIERDAWVTAGNVDASPDPSMHSGVAALRIMFSSSETLGAMELFDWAEWKIQYKRADVAAETGVALQKKLAFLGAAVTTDEVVRKIGAWVADPGPAVDSISTELASLRQRSEEAFAKLTDEIMQLARDVGAATGGAPDTTESS